MDAIRLSGGIHFFLVIFFMLIYNVPGLFAQEKTGKGRDCMEKSEKKKLVILAIVGLLIIAGVVLTIVLIKRKPDETSNTRSKNDKKATKEDIGLIPPVIVTYNENEDTDGDGLINSEEEKYGTDRCSTDTDADGLSDYDEIYLFLTDPCNPDTDDDGLKDGLELMAGLDPTNPETNGKPDTDIKREMTYALEQGTLTVTGDAGIIDIYTDTYSCSLSGAPGVLSPVHEFYMDDMHFDSAVLSISYDREMLEACSGDISNVAIYQFCNDGALKKVGGEVDEASGTVSVELEHFSKYLAADSSVIGKTAGVQMAFVIDESGSMYSKEMCPDSEENDVEFKRYQMVESLMEQFDGDFRYMLTTFSGAGTYKRWNDSDNEEDGFTEMGSSITSAISEIKNATEHTFNGTDIDDGLYYSAQEFGKDVDPFSRRFVILLTDGLNASGLFDFDSVASKWDAISMCNRKGITVITVGIGNAVDTDFLRDIANETGGFFVYAKDTDALNQIYDLVYATMNNLFVDTDGDKMNDSIIVADSGFDVKKDGFCFNNYFFKSGVPGTEVKGGQCYGLSLVAQMYYAGELPLMKEDLILEDPNHPGQTKLCAYGYDVSQLPLFAQKGNLHDFNLLLHEEWVKLFSDEVYALEDENHLVYQGSKIPTLVSKSPLLSIEVKKNGKPTTYILKGKKYKDILYKDVIAYTTAVNLDRLTPTEKENYEFLLMVNYWADQTDFSRVEELRFGGGNNEGVLKAHPIDPYASRSLDEKFELLVRAIASGKVPVMAAYEHAVNAIRITRDINNPDEFNLYIYDTNAVDQEGIIKIVRTKEVDGKAYKENGSIRNYYTYTFWDPDGAIAAPGGSLKPWFQLYTGE